jgi:hypothetical protein
MAIVSSTGCVDRMECIAIHRCCTPKPSPRMLVPLYLAGTAATLDLGFPVRILEGGGTGSGVNEPSRISLRFNGQVGPPVVADTVTIMEAVSTNRDRPQSAVVTVDTKYQSGARPCCFDQNSRQAFEHWIRNSTDAMTGGGKLSLRIRNARDWKGEDDEVSALPQLILALVSRQTSEQFMRALFSTKGRKLGLVRGLRNR